MAEFASPRVVMVTPVTKLCRRAFVQVARHRGTRHSSRCRTPCRRTRAGRTPGEELWVRSSPDSIVAGQPVDQAAAEGARSREYPAFGAHNFDSEGNYIGGADDAEREAAWKEYFQEYGHPAEGAPDSPPAGSPPAQAAAPVDEAVSEPGPTPETEPDNA